LRRLAFGSDADSALEIGVSGKSLAEEVENFAAFFRRDAAFGDGFLGEVAEAGDERGKSRSLPMCSPSLA
jgi:hypothetical protein